MPLAVLLLGIAIGLLGLGIDLQVILASVARQRTLPDALVYYWTFFTHVSNAGLVLIYLAELTRWRGLGWFRRPVTKALWAANITLVMVFYHVMLAPYLSFEGAMLLANTLLHYVAPLLYLAWWALGTGHGVLRLRDIPVMLVPGLLYLAWALGRGAVVGEYPYDILDVTAHGYSGVAVGAGIIVVAVALFCLLMVGVDRLLGRRIGPLARRDRAPDPR